MINFAKFEIIGRVGEIDAKTKVTNISVCANYRRRAEGDQWIEDSYWNRVVIYSDGQRIYIVEKAQVSELVRIAGRLRNTDFQREVTNHYTTDRTIDTIG